MSTITLSVAGDQSLGDPEFSVDVDGVQVGEPDTITAAYSAGTFEQFTITGNFALTTDSVITINYINDLSGPSGDRNLYVGSLTANGLTFLGNVAAVGTSGFLTNAGALWTDGSLSYSMAAPVVAGLPATVAASAGMAVNPFAGVTVSDPASSPQDSVEIVLTAYGVVSDADGLLSGAGLAKIDNGTYTLSATNPTALGAEMAALVFTPAAQPSGSAPVTTGFEVIAGNASGNSSATTAVVSQSPAAAAQLDTIVIEAAGDQYDGDAMFTVDVNGVQVGGPYSVSTLYSSGTFQRFALSGNFGITSGSTVAVNYINDASGRGGDRNLYVGSVTIDGQTYQGSVAAIGTNGVLSNAGALWSDGSLTFTATPPATSTGHLDLVGVNLSGQEQLTLPDVYPSDGEIQYYASKGLNIIRLPIAWERLQPTLGGPLSASELSQVARVVSYANSLGMAVDLDLHNYGNYNGQPISSAAVPISDFVNVWGQLATQFAGSNVLFGLMNEPSLPASTWLTAQNSAIGAIRAAGATTQTILVSGIDYDTASTWISSGNAATFGNSIVDPDNNYAFEVHQYFDSDGSGVGGDTVSATIGEQDLAAITEWANQNNARLFLGEFGSNSDSTALANLQNTLSYMAANSHVWLGGTEWEASTLYNYYFNVAPVDAVDSPQITVLDQFAPGTATTAAAATAVAASEPTAILAVAGTDTQTALTDQTTATPFAGVTITDTAIPSTVAALLTLSAASADTDANGLLSGTGLSHTGAGAYSLTAATLAALSSELASLVFTPTSHEVAPGATITTDLTVTVEAAGANVAMASSNLLAKAVDTAPTLTGLNGTTKLIDSTTAHPFSGLVVTDPDVGADPSATITLTVAGAASDANGVLSGTGLSHTGAGTYALGADSPAGLTGELQQLSFLPTVSTAAAGSTATTGIALTVAEGTAVTPGQSSIVTTAAGPPVTSVTVNLSEDYYLTNAQCTVTVDGQQVGGVQTISAIHSQGHYDALTFRGQFGIGTQTIGVTFLNDAYGGSPSLDRNLYVNSVAVNGATLGGTSASLYTDGTATISATASGTLSGVAAAALTSSSGITETIVAH